MKKILMTGGGTAGHVTPNIALMPLLKEKGYEIVYIGSKHGIEKKLIENEGIPYYGISSGKLRRYFDLKNFSDLIRVTLGFFEALGLMRKLKPDVVFSKGGFVTVPVVWAARFNRIPIVLHESDYTPGLANKLAMPYAKAVCTTFQATATAIKGGKGVWTGSPIRKEILSGHPLRALKYCGFDGEKPVVLVTGGSLGARALNKVVRESLPEVLADFHVVHLCGKGNLDPTLSGKAGYFQLEYASKEMADLLALADIIVSRAGANTLSELLALRKPNILVPLPAAGSRGDQILNAKSFESEGYSYVLPQEELTAEQLYNSLLHVYEDREGYVLAMEESPVSNGIEKVVEVIVHATGSKSVV